MFAAIGIGVAVGIIVGLGVIASWTTLNIAPVIIAASPPTETLTPTPTFAPTPTATPPSTITPTSTATPRPKPTRPPQSTRPSTRFASGPRPVVEHFLFGRPLALDAPAPAPNSVYLYGTTELGKYEVHHGVDFDRNPIGVSAYAVGDGVVVSAGDDRKPICGNQGLTVCGRFLNFYGLVTVIRLDQKYRGQTLFALYGHQDRMDVQVGQRVKRGDAIGTVGITGVAIGPHTQFEIRIGANDYASTRNPMLWIAPLPGRGVLAGRYTDVEGNPMRGAVIDIYRADEPTKFYRETETYDADEQPNVNSDDEFGENFLMSDLPAGDYIVRVLGKQFIARTTVRVGRMGWVEFGE